jgi:nitrogen fixation NifU-like protein
MIETDDALAVAPEDELYKENILDHYRHPRHQAPLERATHEITDKNPLCGDTITVRFNIEDDVIRAVSFSGTGCAISQAAMSMVSDVLPGKSVPEALAMDAKDVLELLGIPIGPVRMKCAMLGLRASQKAIGGMHHE